MSVIDFDELLRAALEARQRAYAPYSGFPVGAAVLTGSGRIYPGCNIENASYPLCLCAERTALAGAIAAGERDLRAMVVVAATAEPVSPCGACRQMLVEFAPDMPLLLANVNGQTQHTTPRELLPGFFEQTALASGRTRASAEE